MLRFFEVWDPNIYYISLRISFCLYVFDDDAFSHNTCLWFGLAGDLETVVSFVVTGEVQSPVSPTPGEPPQDEKPRPLQSTLIPPTVLTLPIKEGMVEKKGHSAAFLMWPK